MLISDSRLIGRYSATNSAVLLQSNWLTSKHTRTCQSLTDRELGGGGGKVTHTHTKRMWKLSCSTCLVWVTQKKMCELCSREIFCPLWQLKSSVVKKRDWRWWVDSQIVRSFFFMMDFLGSSNRLSLEGLFWFTEKGNKKKVWHLWKRLSVLSFWKVVKIW